MLFSHLQLPCDLKRLNLLAIRLYAIEIIAAFILCALAPQAIASNGDGGTVPFGTKTGKPAYSKQSGLQIGVDSTWAGNRGYRPVTVTAIMTKPATADTQITIIYRVGGWGFNRHSISVEADFELPRGAVAASTNISVPQYTDWNITSWEVWVDGVKDEELCMVGTGFNSGNTEATAVGVFRNTAAMIPPWFGNSNSSGVETHPLSLVNLPDRWIDYSPLDVLATSTVSLELLRVSSPKKLAELLRWVRSGGNLWVIDVGQDFSELSKLEKLLGPALDDDDDDEAAGEKVSLSDWHFLKTEGKGRPRLNDLVSMTMQVPIKEDSLSTARTVEGFDLDLVDAPEQWPQLFVACKYGMGTVVAWREANAIKDSFAKSSSQPLEDQYGEYDGEYGGGGGYGGMGGEDASLWPKVTSHFNDSSIIQNLDWATRHGNDPAGGNPNFNHLLIPDVGAAPVFEFQMLISLFVIGIGPVNYWLLKRRNQLPMLLVTVPLAALVATVALFTYGFLADGIGVRVRVRSMTMLDQQAGEAASWARLSYYAGIAPSDGLQMPKDTVVYPILPSRSGRSVFGRRHVNQQRSLEWTNEQKLTRGWLGSRTPTQYLAITARPTKKQLQFKTDSEQLTVTNRLGTDVLALIVQGHDGQIYFVDSVDAEGTVTLSPSTYIKAASTLRKILTEHLPQLPAGYVEGTSSRQSYNDYNVSMTDSLMELQFEAMVSPVAIGWGNGTYLAVTAEGIEVPLGIDGASESSSFHVVRGTW